MRYVSTRGSAPAIGFGELLLAGPAPDGGLYMPEQWPLLHRDQLRGFAGAPYTAVAERIIGQYTGDVFAPAELRADIAAAYATFSHKAVAPLAEIAPNLFLLELFHGPTLSFKDVAMQWLGRLFARALAKRGGRATVLVATSGDTGSAAIAAFRGAQNIDVVVLHPKDRISEVQRRQMTTVLDENVHNFALEGSFDDAQKLVKALFADRAFAAATHLAALNSINFARIAAQCVYYFTAAAALGATPARPVTFVVPTGNFGDVFAGEAAWRMGLPIERLVAATNANDILARALESGRYETGRAQATLSPAMDIQLASNFERALFTATGRNDAWLAKAMRGFAASGRLDIPSDALANLRQRYLAGRANDDETLASMARIYAKAGILIDPHTAVAVAVAAKAAKHPSGPVVVLATAHPAKFPEAVKRATGVTPDLPPALADLSARKERYDIMPNEPDALKRIVMERIHRA
jgi:threonine synthase